MTTRFPFIILEVLLYSTHFYCRKKQSYRGMVHFSCESKFSSSISFHKWVVFCCTQLELQKVGPSHALLSTCWNVSLKWSLKYKYLHRSFVFILATVWCPICNIFGVVSARTFVYLRNRNLFSLSTVARVKRAWRNYQRALIFSVAF